MLQNRLTVGPVGGALSNVGPGNSARFINDKDGGRSNSIAHQIVHFIRGGHGMVGIGQEGEGSGGHLGHALCTGYVVHGQRHDLGVAFLKGLVVVLQIHDLLATGASGLSPVKDENHVRFAPVIAEGDRYALGAVEGEVGGNGLWLRCYRQTGRR